MLCLKDVIELMAEINSVLQDWIISNYFQFPRNHRGISSPKSSLFRVNRIERERIEVGRGHKKSKRIHMELTVNGENRAALNGKCLYLT